ncbi:insulinase family protein, partial [bacterium]|nr:insulinase family protein [bacterium]
MHRSLSGGLKTAGSLTLMMALTLVVSPSHALDPESMAEHITVETLDNGLTLIVYERATAPVVSFFTHVDVGSAQEVPGITGLAHMFEHMAFKGTTKIGTTNSGAEAKALEKVDRAYYALQVEQQKIGGPDPEIINELEQAMLDAQEKANEYVKPNEFTEIIERSGGVGVNAFTNTDTTGYFYSLPANKVELWAYLESERFVDPVFREFYKERDVVQEERRMRTESNPFGRMLEQFQMTAFQAHPYKQPVVGYMSDLHSFTRGDAEAFYQTYYVPANMTISVVGDVDAKTIMPMLRSYFGRLQAGPEPPPLRTVEPKAIAEKNVTLYDKSQPLYVEGYHRPAATHPDDAVYDAIGNILSSGRTSRLYKSMVRDSKIAAQQGVFNGYPGTKYPHLVLFFAVPTP